MDLSYKEFLNRFSTDTDAAKEKDSGLIIRTLGVIHGKWKEHVLFLLLQKECRRFGELQKAIPEISKTMLSTVLKQLEADGLVLRKQFNEMPPRTEYSLTESGRELMLIFYEMLKWGRKYLERGQKHSGDEDEQKCSE